MSEQDLTFILKAVIKRASCLDWASLLPVLDIIVTSASLRSTVGLK
jgi:hypothetical protein